MATRRELQVLKSHQLEHMESASSIKVGEEVEEDEDILSELVGRGEGQPKNRTRQEVESGEQFVTP